MKNIKIGIICSPGGHLVEALHILPAFENADVFLITYYHSALENFKNPKIRKVFFIKFLGATKIRLFANFLLNSVHMMYILLKENPDVLFSSGSEIAVPAFYIGKIFFGTKLIFLESITRIDDVGYTAKLVYGISDLFLIQWPSLLKILGKKAQYKGSLL